MVLFGSCRTLIQRSLTEEAIMAGKQGEARAVVTTAHVGDVRKVTVTASGTNPDEVLKAARAAASAAGTSLPSGK